jgi:hypothetical protein
MLVRRSHSFDNKISHRDLVVLNNRTGKYDVNVRVLLKEVTCRFRDQQRSLSYTNGSRKQDKLFRRFDLNSWRHRYRVIDDLMSFRRHLKCVLGKFEGVFGYSNPSRKATERPALTPSR